MVQTLPNLLRGAFTGILVCAGAYGNPDISSTNELLEETISETESVGLLGKLGASREWVVFPIPSYNPSFGWTVAVPAMVLYRPTGTAEDSQAWATGLVGFYAENESFGGGLFHRMNFREDTWRLSGGLGYSDLNYDYYGSGEIGGDPDRYVTINQVFSGFSMEAQRMVRENFYAGIGFRAFSAEIKSLEFSFSDTSDFLPPWKGLRLDFLTIIPHLVFDSRDNEFYPGRGNLVDLKVSLSGEAIGSDNNYQLYEFYWNHYRTVGEGKVLAFRVAFKYANDDAPFFLLPAMGQGADLRGYVVGLYRDKVLLAGQMEYRIRLTNRLGAVLFGGVGGVAPDWSSFNEALPSVGGGIRWLLAKENQLNLRVDVAWGKDNQEVYVSIGEVF
jgi:outer membrane protein assembly factor BamA